MEIITKLSVNKIHKCRRSVNKVNITWVSLFIFQYVTLRQINGECVKTVESSFPSSNIITFHKEKVNYKKLWQTVEYLAKIF